jgi:anti-sigma B factor antagonist
MDISIKEASGSTGRVSLAGKLDILGAEKVAVPLAAVTGGSQNVIIDMSGVTFIASIGIRSLVASAKALARKGGRLILVGLTAPVHEVLQTAGITELVSTATSDDEALQMLASA